jgi:hypothetical protein
MFFFTLFTFFFHLILRILYFEMKSKEKKKKEICVKNLEIFRNETAKSSFSQNLV